MAGKPPAARRGHVAAAVEDKVYVWGGLLGYTGVSHDGPDKTDIIVKVDVLDLKEWVWQQKRTTGSPPLGIEYCAFTVEGRRVVVYGGYCGHHHCYHNSLHELNTMNLVWTVLTPSEAAEGAPMKKGACGIVVYSSSGEKHLCVFGGYGLLNSASHPTTAQYKEYSDGVGHTNELHIFTSGCWSSPTVTGSTPPPCSGFSFTKISEERVVMFGGDSPVSDPQRMNNIYTLVLSTLHWIRVSRPDDTTIPWPVGRAYHSSCLLAGPLTGHQHPVVIVVGGLGDNVDTLSDLWIMKREQTWKKVTIDDESMIERRKHNITAITISSSLVVVVVFGGQSSSEDVLSDTFVLEFELRQSVNSEKEWVMTMAARLNNYMHLARLEQLMREKGKLTISVVECMPLGPPRIGKTCLKDRLAGKKPKGKPAKMVDGKVVYPNEVSVSTGTLEGVVKMVVETTYQEQEQGKQWVQRTFNQEIVSFIKGAETSHFPTQAQPSRLSSMLKQEQPKIQCDTHKMQSVPFEKQSSTLGTNPADQHSSVHKQELQSSTSSVQTMESHLSHDPPQVRYAPPEVMSKALLHKGSSLVQSLEGSLMIHFTDTGGQSEFHEVLPALVSGPCIFFLCFSLPAGLDHQYKVWYDCHNERSRLYDSSFSVKAVMLQCLGSISCIGTQRRRDREIVNVKPKVFFIGTQQDLVSEEEIKQIDSELRQAIKHREELNSLVEYCTTDPSQIVFPVNSYDEEDKSFQAVREAVHAVAEREEEMYKVSIPVPFATLDFCLRMPTSGSLMLKQVDHIAKKHGMTLSTLKSGVEQLLWRKHATSLLNQIDFTDPDFIAKAMAVLTNTSGPVIRVIHELNNYSRFRVPVLSLDEFVAKAKECNVSQEEIKDALWTLHHLLGTIRHFPDSTELEDLVITNSQLFFDVVTKITTSTFNLEQNRELLTPQACIEFHEKGFFTVEDLDKVWSHEKQYLSSKQLVALLEHLHILAPLEYEGKSMFFLPCALSHAPLPQADRSSLPEPFGSFKLLLVSLLVSFACGFTPKGIFSGLIAYLLKHANKNGLLWELIGKLLYRDQASLWVVPCVYLTMQATPTFIQFSLYQQPNTGSIDPLSVSVHRVIEDGLKEVASRLNYTVNVEPKLGFECTCDTQKPIHFTEYKNEPFLKCVVSGTFCRPPPDYMKWFKGSQITIAAEKHTHDHTSLEEVVEKKLASSQITQHVGSQPFSGDAVTGLPSDTCLTSSTGISAGDKTLGIADLKDVNEYVFELSFSQFTQLGLQLGLLQPTLEKIADCTKPEGYGTKVMAQWLKRVDNVKPTWNNLTKALDKRTVKGHAQANQIREDLKTQDSAHKH